MSCKGLGLQYWRGKGTLFFLEPSSSCRIRMLRSSIEVGYAKNTGSKIRNE